MICFFSYIFDAWWGVLDMQLALHILRTCMCVAHRTGHSFAHVPANGSDTPVKCYGVKLHGSFCISCVSQMNGIPESLNYNVGSVTTIPHADAMPVSSNGLGHACHVTHLQT